MKNASGLRIIGLMEEVTRICNEIMATTKEELVTAEEKDKDKATIGHIKKEIEVLNRIMRVANAVSQDVHNDKLGFGTHLLVHITSDGMPKMLQKIANKRSLTGTIQNSFKEADALMNNR